jgi:phosphoglycolate phosphatase
MTRFDAVLFDLDGTLLDTLEDLAGATNRALRRLGLPTHEVSAFRTFVGEGVEMLAARVLPEESQTPADVARTVALIREEYGHSWAVATRPYPGISELLTELERRRLPMAVLSNKPDDFTQAIVAKLLSAWRFAAVQGALPGVAKKPDPTSALAVARALGKPPSRIAFVGDTKIDVQTARAAGMTPFGALWGFRTAEELREAGAAVLLATPLELLPRLD